VPHDYIELPGAIEARYLRMENLHVPTGKFALSACAFSVADMARNPTR